MCAFYKKDIDPGSCHGSKNLRELTFKSSILCEEVIRGGEERKELMCTLLYKFPHIIRAKKIRLRIIGNETKERDIYIAKTSNDYIIIHSR